MPKITDEPVVKFELTLFKSDYDALRRLYPPTGPMRISKVIRTVVRAYVRQVQARASASIDVNESANGIDLVAEDISA